MTNQIANKGDVHKEGVSKGTTGQRDRYLEIGTVPDPAARC